MKHDNDSTDFSLVNNWEEMVLEHAIETFPYKEVFEYLPGYRGDDRKFLVEMIESSVLKIGFYYEEMQEDLTIFYFLQMYDETYILLGFDNEIQVEIASDEAEIFPLDDEQFLALTQIQPS